MRSLVCHFAFMSDNAVVGQIVGKKVKIRLFIGFFGWVQPFFKFSECL